MPLGRLSAVQLAARALRETATRPTLLVPALVLLLPSVALQLALPTYLRTRLAPSPWTVAAGSVLLVWLNQIALPAVIACVHARRSREMCRLDGALLRRCLAVGTRVTLALAAAVVPGVWLQARYAFATLLERDERDVVRGVDPLGQDRNAGADGQDDQQLFEILSHGAGNILSRSGRRERFRFRTSMI